MLANAFAGSRTRPTEKALAKVLGESYGLWQRLVGDLKRDLDLDGEEWNSSGVKHGWSLRLQRKKRNIVYLGPRAGFFVAAFILGDRAIAAAKASNLPRSVLQIIEGAKRYAEGTAVRIEVRSRDDLNSVKLLAQIKIEN